MDLPIDLSLIKSEADLLKQAKWLEGKTLREITKEIRDADTASRVLTKGAVGYAVEKGFFGISANSDANPDIAALGIEIKTSPLKFNTARTHLTVKEPLSLNMINYCEEYKNKTLSESSMFRKNKNVLFVWYIHDDTKDRSDYLIKYVFLWKMDDAVLNDLEADYQKIIAKIKEGKAHEIHQPEHRHLTLCPKHNGDFKDPHEFTSKIKQPFSDKWAERRAFRLKNSYMNMVICKATGEKLERGGWRV